jgi:hypothetical protein
MVLMKKRSITLLTRRASVTRIRLWGFTTFDGRCQSRPAPRVRVCAQPRYGRIVMRYETYKITSQQFGTVRCVGTTQRGIAMYYFINPEFQTSNAFERIEVDAYHWAASPSPVTVRHTFQVDLASKTSKRSGRGFSSRGQ